MTCKINADTSDGLKIVSDTSGEIDLQIDASTKVHMASDGKVGIGTSSPSKPLQVKQTAAGSGLSQTDIRATRDEYGADFSGYIDQGVGHGAIISSVDNGTATERMRLTGAGKIGIGTTSPSSAVTVVGVVGSQFIGTQLETDDTSKYATYAGKHYHNSEQHIAGLTTNSNGTDNAVLLGGGIGECNAATNIKLYTAANDATTTGTERMRLNNEGELFIGTTTNTANTTLVVQANTGVNSGIGVQTDHTGVNAAMYFMNTNGIVGSIVTSGSNTSFNTTSDYRLKENVTYTFDATTRLKQLKPARFNFIADADTTVDGFLAHEVSSIVPEAIVGTKDATTTRLKTVKDKDGNFIASNVEEADWTAGKQPAIGKYPNDSTWTATEELQDYQSIDQSKLVPLLVKTIQELEARITALES